MIYVCGDEKRLVKFKLNLNIVRSEVGDVVTHVDWLFNGVLNVSQSQELEGNNFL